ncbi:Centromere protein V [Madurella mycetomatis]|uniref:Centromere protein V n=1 Tax=Madurella mycetomatis TaxID=100816 RepID=A0A175WCP6_9PEZI|nr:Centromere protein V [Madurella mycetomatis]
MSAATNNLKTYTGGCHCGAIRYSVALDLSGPNPEATKCNCSICLKTNRMGVKVTDPGKNFKLLAPASLDDMSDYCFNTKSTHHRFCNNCGVHCFLHGRFVLEDQEISYFGLNAVTLDPDQEGLDFRSFNVKYWDGKNWDGKPENLTTGTADKPYPGGTY